RVAALRTESAENDISIRLVTTAVLIFISPSVGDWIASTVKDGCPERGATASATLLRQNPRRRCRERDCWPARATGRAAKPKPRTPSTRREFAAGSSTGKRDIRTRGTRVRGIPWRHPRRQDSTEAPRV